MEFLVQALGLIASLSLLIFVHELGHYLFARLFKTRVEKFYLFFNPGFTLARMKKINGKWQFSFFSKESPEEWAEHPDNTEWGLGWIPLGGYCSIAGMIDETKSENDLESEPQPWEFRSKPAWQRFFIIVGGVMMNFIFALLFFASVMFVWGKEYIPVENAKYGLHFSTKAQELGFETGDKVISVGGTKPKEISDFITAMLIDDPKEVLVERGGVQVTIPLQEDSWKEVLGESFCQYNIPFVVDSVVPEMPAALANLKKGDSLIAINNVPCNSFFDFQQYFTDYKDAQVSLLVIRAGTPQQVAVTIGSDGKIGVFPKTNYLETATEHYTLLGSIPAGINWGIDFLGLYIKQFKRVFTKEGASQIGGFGAIGSIFPKSWDWQRFWTNTAILSVILAFMNILPIPALDGGYLLFILVEIITRRKPSDKFIGIANTIGFSLLIILLLYANGMDIVRAFF